MEMIGTQCGWPSSLAHTGQLGSCYPMSTVQPSCNWRIIFPGPGTGIHFIPTLSRLTAGRNMTKFEHRTGLKKDGWLILPHELTWDKMANLYGGAVG